MRTIHGLSSGKINLTTGQTRYFNVFENNTDNDTLILVQSVDKGTYTVIAGAGSAGKYEAEYGPGTNLNLSSGGRGIKHCTGVGVYPNTISGLAEIKEIVRKNRCSFWVIK